MNAFDALAGWKLKATLAAIMVGLFSAGIGTLWLTYKATEKDRGQIITSFETACSYVAVPYRVNSAGKPLARKAWGTACLAEILKLATERAGAAQAALTTYTTHDTEQTAKAAWNRAAARRSATRIQSAQQTMEVAIATAQDGHLGPDYFDGLNRSLGLRPYIAAAEDRDGSGHAEGEAVERPAGVQ